MNSGTAIRMKGSTPPMNDRKIVSSGCERPATRSRRPSRRAARTSAARRPARARRTTRKSDRGEHRLSPAALRRAYRRAGCATRSQRDEHGHRRAADRQPRYWNAIGTCSTVSSLPQPAIAMPMPYQTSERQHGRGRTASIAPSAARGAAPVQLVDEFGDRHLRAAPRRAGAAEERHPHHQQFAEFGDPGDVLAARRAASRWRTPARSSSRRCRRRPSRRRRRTRASARGAAAPAAAVAARPWPSGARAAGASQAGRHRHAGVAARARAPRRGGRAAAATLAPRHFAGSALRTASASARIASTSAPYFSFACA